jgi:predicted CDP-diglyceride synthetase/phosphatidate cytidylyltransferase
MMISPGCMVGVITLVIIAMICLFAVQRISDTDNIDDSASLRTFWAVCACVCCVVATWLIFG